MPSLMGRGALNSESRAKELGRIERIITTPRSPEGSRGYKVDTLSGQWTGVPEEVGGTKTNNNMIASLAGTNSTVRVIWQTRAENR